MRSAVRSSTGNNVGCSRVSYERKHPLSDIFPPLIWLSYTCTLPESKVLDIEQQYSSSDAQTRIVDFGKGSPYSTAQATA